MLFRWLDPFLFQGLLIISQCLFLLPFFHENIAHEIGRVSNHTDISWLFYRSNGRFKHGFIDVIIRKSNECINELQFTLPTNVINDLYSEIATFLLATLFMRSSYFMARTPSCKSSISWLSRINSVPLSSSMYSWYSKFPFLIDYSCNIYYKRINLLYISELSKSIILQNQPSTPHILLIWIFPRR